MYAHFSDRARAIINNANQIAVQHNHASLGLEHILLGCSGVGGLVKPVLRAIDPHGTLLPMVQSMLVAGNEPTIGKLELTPQARLCVNFAEAYAVHDPYGGHVQTHHLLMGVLDAAHDDGGIVARAIARNATHIDRRDCLSTRDEISRWAAAVAPYLLCQLVDIDAVTPGQPLPAR